MIYDTSRVCLHIESKSEPCFHIVPGRSTAFIYFHLFPVPSESIHTPRKVFTSESIDKVYGTTQTLPSAGCPTKLSNWARRTLVREETKNPLTTLIELQSSLADMGEPARRTPVSTALPKSRLYGWVARRKPVLRKRHMTACLEFAKRHVKDWKHEAKYSVFGWDENWTLWYKCKPLHLAETEPSTAHHHPTPSPLWSMVVAASCYGDVFSSRDWKTCKDWGNNKWS